MKMQNKLLIISLATAVVAGFVYSQVYFSEKNRKELKEIAKEIAFQWREKLDLSLVQTLQLEGIIIAFTIKKNEIIQASIPEYKKIKRLQKVQVKEHKMLKKVLDEEQFKAYVGINKKMPATVVGSVSI